MSSDLTKTDPKVFVTLGDKEYEIKPLTLNVMEAIEDNFGSMEQVAEALRSKPGGTTKKLLMILLKTDLKPEQIGELVSLHTNLAEVSTRIAETLRG